ncbi:MAG: DNA polymerase III subunit gamma/tau [Erysipelotrichaceae bacterium]|nr:DNA polymerase III subunit gamma/tau [Erysipelotrichaceae bacterium]
MAYKALYRKYRPETFESVVGQQHITKTLQNAILQNKVAHAYLFSGPRGTGKTTTAKLLAKALNCSNETHRPCNECANCIAINNNSHPDVIEIDAASNNGVDEIRDLIEKVKYAPIEGKYKVYIIDEVHMMTQGAFNALLKTLEEPPEHVVFILATTDVHKVLPTVISRCQRFDFSKVSDEGIKNRIEEILNLENITFDKEVPPLIAELADGGMRDALSILDQVVSYASNNIKPKHIYDIYGMMSNQDMVSYLSIIAKRQTKEVLTMIEQYIARGIDVKRLTYDLMICLKDAIVYKSTNDESILERLNSTQASKILENISIENALKITSILNEARSNYRLSTNYRLFFELASLKMMEIFKDNDEKEEKVIVNTRKEETLTKIVEEKPTIIESKEVTTNTKQNQYNVPSESEVISYSQDEYINILIQGDKKVKERLLESWKDIRKYIDKAETRYIAQLLSDSTIGVANKNFVMIVYDFKLLALRAKQKNNLLLIKKFLNDIFNIDVEVYVVERPTFIDLTHKFFELKQANKLPAPHDIPHLNEAEHNLKIESIVSESEELKDATIEIGKDLFGDELKID